MIHNFELFKVLFFNIHGVPPPSSKKMATHEELESVRWRIHLSPIITGLSKLDQSEGDCIAIGHCFKEQLNCKQYKGFIVPSFNVI